MVDPRRILSALVLCVCCLLLTPYASAQEECVVVEVPIDLKPGSCPNCVRPGGNRGVTPVAILGATEVPVDVTEIDPASVRLAVLGFNGGIPAERCKLSFGDDLYLDLVCHFRAVGWPLLVNDLLGYDCGQVMITAELFDGTAIHGHDDFCLAGGFVCEEGIEFCAGFVW